MNSKVHMARSIKERVEIRYDGDRDTLAGVPTVTWSDAQILDALGFVIEYAEQLEQRIVELERKQRLSESRI
jgi:hypothetical protein